MNEPLITQNPKILGGIPVFYRTRVPIRNLLGYLPTGDDSDEARHAAIDEFLDDFPSVSREQVMRFLSEVNTKS